LHAPALSPTSPPLPYASDPPLVISDRTPLSELRNPCAGTTQHRQVCGLACTCPRPRRDQLDTARHAIDVTVCNNIDTIGSSNLTDMRRAFSSPSAGPALGEARNWFRLAAKLTQEQLMVPDWVPCFAFHPVSFDRASGTSSLRILDFTAVLSPRRNLKLASRAGLSKSFHARSRR
jgi:hypothetical protein